MLTPDYLDTLPDALVELWRTVEDDVLRDMGRRIAKMGELTPTANWQAWRFEQTQALHQDVVLLLAKYSGKSDAVIRQLLQQAGYDTLAADDALYRSWGFAPSDINTNPALLELLNAGYRQTRGTWKNLTGTTARTVTRQFENALDRAWLQVSTGAFDYKTAIKRAVDGLAAHMDGVTYPSGHHDSLEVAARRAVLTGVNQTAAKLQLARAEEMGCEFVEVSAHAGARPEHALWQGKVYHVGGAIYYQGQYYEDFAAATGYGTVTGLAGANCRHNFSVFWPGLSEPNYTQKDLDALNAKEVAYKGKLYSRYEISQMQRGKERAARAAKRKYLAEDAAGLDAAAAAKGLRDARSALKAFVQETGGPLDSARIGVSGFGRGQAARAVQAAKPFASFKRTHLATAPDQLLPNYTKAHIPREKLSGYALNMEHPGGGRNKAIAFERALGYTAGNAKDLERAVFHELSRWKATPRAATKYGQPFEVPMLLKGPNGQYAKVKTGWIIDDGADFPRLITIHVDD